MGKFSIRIFAALIFLGQILIAEAHPGIGMVYDGKDTIYYTDLEHIWKYDISTGIKSIVIPNVHSHELYLDSAGSLYGEHYFYVQEEQKFNNYIWKYSKEGAFSIIRPEKDGENTDFSFIRDKHFNAIQFNTKDGITEIRKVFTDSSRLIHRQAFKDLRWKSFNRNNELLFIDLYSLYKIDHTEQIQLLVEDLSSMKFPFSFNDEKHNVYGAWSDSNDNTYVAIYGGRIIKRIDKDKEISTIYKSSFFWSPLNGLFDKENQLWVMEGSLWGDVRIRKVEQANELKSNGLPIWVLFTFLLIVFLLMLRKKRKTALSDAGIY